MRNWSGHLRWQPSVYLQPDSEEAIKQLVIKAAEEGRKIRVIGSGHSFSSLCPTDDYLLSLDNFQGIIEVDAARKQVRVKAGTKLNQLNLDLAKHGLALENLGDIDVQSIAGAISTGTHGTGLDYGNLSTQVRALSMINGKGELIHCSPQERYELFKAAQISLGSLGVITEVTLQCVSAYRLKLFSEKKEIGELLSN